jgi:hypothetical protein
MALYITEKEFKLAEKSILLPMVCNVLELNSKHMQNFKIPRQAQKDAIISRILIELRDIKKEMFQRGIKVAKKKSVNGSVVEWEVLCRGYIEQLQFDKKRLEAIVEELLAKYLGVDL